MTRFTYVQHNENLVEILETGGLFFGYTIEEVQSIAERLNPNYQSVNLSNTFPNQFFNFTLRKALLCTQSQASMTSQGQALNSQTPSDESGKNKSNTTTDSLLD